MPYLVNLALTVILILAIYAAVLVLPWYVGFPVDEKLWPTMGASFVAIVTAVLGIFKDNILELLTGPEMEIQLKSAESDCHLTALGQPGQVGWPVYYFRIRVYNKGRKAAERVEVLLDNVQTKQSDGKFLVDSTFLPLNLWWSHARVVERQIQPFGIFKYCDLGLVVHPAPQGTTANAPLMPTVNSDLVFWFDVTDRPNASKTYLPPGIHRFDVTASAANTRPVSKTFEIDWKGQWKTSNAAMFSQGISFREI